MGKMKELAMEQSERDQDLLIADLDHEVRQLKARLERIEAELSQARNNAIEEVAVAIEKFRVPFGHDTVHSFAVYVRGLKT